jgi:hypothetical protein
LAKTRSFINTVFQICFRICQENHIGLKLNGKHQLLSFDDNANQLWDNLEIIKKNRNFNWY